MALIVLPRKTSRKDVTEAERKLKAVLADPLTVLVIVYGEGPDTDKILEVCCARVLVKPAIRRVVWVPDPTVLTEELKTKYWRQGSVAVSIGLDDQIAKELTLEEAMVRIYVERAFLYAEGQGGA